MEILIPTMLVSGIHIYTAETDVRAVGKAQSAPPLEVNISEMESGIKDKT